MHSRRTSLSNSGKKVYLDKNNISEATEIHVENIADAKKITSEQLEDEIMSELRFTEDNLERLDTLEQLKGPYLFCSDDLLQIVEVTTSLKTRIEMITIIGPRLTDPSAKVSAFTDMFRFAEDKKSVEEVLKARMQAINSAKFTNNTVASALRPGSGRGGRGLTMVPAGGGRSGRGAGGRGRGIAPNLSPARPVSVPVPHAEHSPVPQPHTPQPVRAAPMTTPTSDINSTSTVVKPEPIPIAFDNKQRSPEICPEEGTISSSPVSLSETDDGAEDSHSTGLDSTNPNSNTNITTSTNNNTATTTRKMTPVPDILPKLPTLPVATTITTAPVKPVPIDISSVGRSLAPLEGTYDSPHTDCDTSTPQSCTTPSEEAHSLSGDVDGRAVKPAESQRTTPVPLFEMTARAPQRAPVVQNRRAGSSAPSPMPTNNNTPTISPSTSSTHLPGLGVAKDGNSASSTSAAHVPAIVVAQPTAKGSYASQCGSYDLSPMVADCKPEVGVHSLLSRFSGSGGTKHIATPSKPPSDVNVIKSRKISDLANAFTMKPATSTASSTMNNANGLPRASSFRNASSLSGVDARSQAPAPIVIPGAATSLAEVRARFSGGKSPSAASASTSPCGKSNSSDESGDGPIKIVRRHSESWGPNSAFALGLAAAAAGGSSSGNGNNGGSNTSCAVTGASAAAEVAGAGADVATRCAAALRISKAEFMSLAPEEPVFVPEKVTDTDLPLYTYREVVRRNFQKQCVDMNQSILEMYVCDDEFMNVFQRTKAEFSRLPRWRQVEQKKKAMLF